MTREKKEQQRNSAFQKFSGKEVKLKDSIKKDFVWWALEYDAKFSNETFDANLIIDRIWLGSMRSAMNQQGLQENSIKYILTVAADLVERVSEQVLLENGNACQEHAILEICDNFYDNILEHLEPALNFIDDCLLAPDGGHILVHCAAGVSRSATVVIAYLMTRKHLTYSAALELVKSNRPVVNPNIGFALQLAELEKCGCDIAKASKTYKIPNYL